MGFFDFAANTLYRARLNAGMAAHADIWINVVLGFLLAMRDQIVILFPIPAEC
jgi:hypothetical protein